MKDWSVQLPIVGVILVEPISVETEEEAIELALRKAKDYLEKASVTPDKSKRVSIEELDAVKQLVSGEICHAPLDSAEAELLDEYDEDEEEEDEEGFFDDEKDDYDSEEEEEEEEEEDSDDPETF
jgi:phosphopantothenoylcysteine synthetase/decarboxylase